MTPSISPPTDNLYKWLAVTGLILLVASLAGPTWQRKELDQVSARFEGDVARLQSERDIADEAETDAVRAFHVHGKELAEVMGLGKDGPATKDGPAPATVQVPAHLKEELDKLGEVMRLRQKTKESLVLREKELDTRRAELFVSRRFLNVVDYWAAILASIGFLATLLGFSKWFGTQSVQDQVQLQELQEEEAEAPAAPKLILPADSSTKSPSRRLRLAGFLSLALGSISLCAIYVAGVHAQCAIETAMLDRESLRMQAAEVFHNVAAKTMDFATIDDMKLRRRNKEDKTSSRKELIEAVEQWGEKDPDIVPLKYLFLRMFLAENQKAEAMQRLGSIKMLSPYGYGIGGLFMFVGLCLLAHHQRQSAHTRLSAANRRAAA